MHVSFNVLIRRACVAALLVLLVSLRLSAAPLVRLLLSLALPLRRPLRLVDLIQRFSLPSTGQSH